MIDARYEAAQATGDRRARERGWSFDEVVDRAPWWISALEVLFRPSAIFSLAILGVCVFVLVNYGGG